MTKISEALIVIDVQNDYFPGGRLETVNPVETAQACAKLVEKFRNEKKEVIHIQHLIPDEAAKVLGEAYGGVENIAFTKGTKGYEINDLVKPLSSEKLIVKTDASSFVRTDLKEYLLSKGIEKLMIVGMMAHNCVNSTVYDGVDEGFKCVVVEDAVNTYDQNYRGEIIPAETIKKSFLSGMQFYYADVFTLEEVLNNNYHYDRLRLRINK